MGISQSSNNEAILVVIYEKPPPRGSHLDWSLASTSSIPLAGHLRCTYLSTNMTHSVLLFKGYIDVFDRQ